MNSKTRTLLTIITETSIEQFVCRDIEHLGARGYTVTDARGKGGHGLRQAGWDADSNIRIETICSPEVAEKISSHLFAKYFDNYAMVVYSHDVNVMRDKKF